MKNKKMIAIILLLICGGFAFGYVMGGTNFGFSGYPEFSRFSPSKPFGSSVSKSEYDRYRYAVSSYVSEAETYIDNCTNDIERILEARQEAIDDANEAIKEFNEFSDYVTISSKY